MFQRISILFLVFSFSRFLWFAVTLCFAVTVVGLCIKELAVFVVVPVVKAMVTVMAVETEMVVGGNASDGGDGSDNNVFGESRGDGGVRSAGTGCSKGE